jgi:YkoY family integral membrane protein
VRDLPRKERRRVLRYGIWGAIGFRFVAVLMSSLLLKFWLCKVVGGLYLLYLATSHFLWPEDNAGGPPMTAVAAGGLENGRLSRGFWKIVTSITLTDIAFSIDSILAAVAMADSFPNRFGPNWKLVIVYVGGVLGIITMRFVVGYFVILLERFPGLAEGAYVLVAWIGLKLLVSGIHDAGLIAYHVPESAFWSVMLLIAVISLLVRPKTNRPEEPELRASLDVFDREKQESVTIGEESDSQQRTPPAAQANADHRSRGDNAASDACITARPVQDTPCDQRSDSRRGPTSV